MTRSDAVWLIEVFKPKRHLRIAKDTIGMFVKAINILLEQDRKVPGCGCEYKITAQIANSAYDQYESEIEKLYNSKPRGRKKKS